MLDRLHAIRSTSGKVVAGLALATTLAIAGCGGTSSTSTGPGAGTTTTGGTKCVVTSSELAATTSGTGAATAIPGLSGQQITADGSSALQPLIKQAAAEFDKANGTMSTVNAGGSGQGLKDANAGAVQVGMSDVFASEKASTPGQYGALTDHQVAAVVFTLVVNNDLQNKVTDLTSDQIKSIFTGQTTNWSAVGGPDEAITVITRTAASGTRATFKKYVLGGTNESATSNLDSTGAVVAAVKATPGAIGYVTVGFANSNASDVSPVCIDEAKPVIAEINAGKYKFWNIEHAYTKGPATGAAKELLKYVLSDQVQNNDVLALGYAQIGKINSTAIQTHTPSGAPAPETLS